jgi:hypothetical protein
MLMNYKNAITITALTVIATTSLGLLQVSNADAVTMAVQPEKFVFTEKISPTAEFLFRDGVETAPFQIFTQTAGFGTSTLEVNKLAKSGDSSERTGRSKPGFVLEKIAGGTPYLYEAADEAQRNILTAGMEFPYKFFDVNIYLAAGDNILRSFEYRDCQVKNYFVQTRVDNEEGYTGKGFAVVEQFSFECDGYAPQNPAMDKMNHVEKAKTVSSSDLKRTDKWEPGFSK